MELTLKLSKKVTALVEEIHPHIPGGNHGVRQFVVHFHVARKAFTVF
jgi:hypothetical protein